MAPDYELDDEVAANTPAQLKVIADPLRCQILDLVLERAATVTELAAALDRPKSSIAYHVDTLVDVGFMKVVRTRKVRAIEERFYGRVARTIVIGDSHLPDGTQPRGFLAVAQSELAVDDPAQMHSTLRHARIPTERAQEFFERIAALADEFTRLPREGETVYGFVAAVYRTDQPTLPEAER
ncbi:MAG: ArsR/SmtB family transcription factor [Ilumatobacteraceae bacterium]